MKLNLNAALNGQNAYKGFAYFFKGDKYIKYDWANDKAVEGYPQPVQSWNLPVQFNSGIDAAFNGSGKNLGKAYFFKNREYVRYDWATNKIDEGYPLSLDLWKLPGDFALGIDAVMEGYGDKAGKVYFFKDNLYVRFDLARDSVDAGYPKQIAERGLKGGFMAGVDAALNGKGIYEGKVYFFRGSEYMRYDWATDTTEGGIKDISGWELNFVTRVSEQRTPIILVPGVMGTRLTLNGSVDWDPDSVTKMLALVVQSKFAHQKLSLKSSPTATIKFDLSLSAKSDIENDSYLSQYLKNHNISLEDWGWGKVAWGFYGKILIQLLKNYNLLPFDVPKPIYAFGYDWRQSNRKSAEHLADFIVDVKRRENIDKVILVTHSMGGLVARAACKFFAKENLVDRVIHTVQPSNGAELAYRRTFTGMTNSDGTDMASLVLGPIMGTDPQIYRDLMFSMDGPLELLPNNKYGKDWIKGFETQVDYKNIYDIYRTIGTPGLLFNSAYNSLDEMIIRLNSAEKFHEDLGSYGHPNTFAMWSSGVSTDEATDITVPNYPKAIKTASGDGTVHRISGNCSGIDPINIKDRKEFQNVEHAKCFSDYNFNLQVIKFIDALLPIT